MSARLVVATRAKRANWRRNLSLAASLDLLPCSFTVCVDLVDGIGSRGISLRSVLPIMSITIDTIPMYDFEETSLILEDIFGWTDLQLIWPSVSQTTGRTAGPESVSNPKRISVLQGYFRSTSSIDGGLRSRTCDSPHAGCPPPVSLSKDYIILVRRSYLLSPVLADELL